MTVHRRTPIESRSKRSERRRLKTGARRTRCRSRSRRRARCSGSRPVPQTWFRNRYNDTRRLAYGNLDSSLHSLMMGPEMGSFRCFILANGAVCGRSRSAPTFILTEESELDLDASTEAAEKTRPLSSVTGGAKWASVESSQAWPQGMFPPPAWQIPSALLKQVSASDEVWAANVENKRSTAELPQSEQAVEFSDCSRRLRTISSNLVPQSKHWYSKDWHVKLSQTKVSGRPGDIESRRGARFQRAVGLSSPTFPNR